MADEGIEKKLEKTEESNESRKMYISVFYGDNNIKALNFKFDFNPALYELTLEQIKEWIAKKINEYIKKNKQTAENSLGIEGLSVKASQWFSGVDQLYKRPEIKANDLTIYGYDNYGYTLTLDGQTKLDSMDALSQSISRQSESTEQKNAMIKSSDILDKHTGFGKRIFPTAQKLYFMCEIKKIKIMYSLSHVFLKPQAVIKKEEDKKEKVEMKAVTSAGMQN